MMGGVLSIRTVRVFAASWLPALSTAKNVSVVVPSAEIVTAVRLPTTTPAPPCAPLWEKWISFTPEPPGSSAAARLIVTFVLFQPFALGAGEGVAVVVGGMESAVAPKT